MATRLSGWSENIWNPWQELVAIASDFFDPTRVHLKLRERSQARRTGSFDPVHAWLLVSSASERTNDPHRRMP